MTPRGALVAVLVGVLAVTACGGLVSPLATNATSTPGSALVDGLPLGTSVHGLAVPGRPGSSFRIHRPASLPTSGPAALVVVLHGDGASALGAENRFGWDPLADRDGFLVAYPDASGRSWNAADGACCGRAAAERSDDLGFLTAMIATIAATVPVDPARIYATGPSVGGIMAYRLACSTGIPAAIGPVAATEPGPCPRPPPRTTVTGPIRTTAADCPDGRAVTLIEIGGAGSGWPGATPRDLITPTAAPAPVPASTALDTAATVWAFFAAHPRRT